jgi:hypothetical protein
MAMRSATPPRPVLPNTSGDHVSIHMNPIGKTRRSMKLNISNAQKFCFETPGASGPAGTTGRRGARPGLAERSDYVRLAPNGNALKFAAPARDVRAGGAAGDTRLFNPPTHRLTQPQRAL